MGETIYIYVSLGLLVNVLQFNLMSCGSKHTGNDF